MNTHLKRFAKDIPFLYEALTQSTDNYVYISDLPKDEVLLSDNMVRDFGYEDNLVKNFHSSWMSRVHERDIERFTASMDDVMAGRQEFHDEEYQVRNAAGAYIWIHCKGKVLRDKVSGTPLFFAGVIENLERQGVVDSVTGLYTYDKCRAELSHALSFKKGTIGGLMLFGIDDFTNINTLNNHVFGDAVLRNMVQDVQKLLPENAQMYRYDGDQFLIAYYGAGREAMSALFRQLQGYTMQTHRLDGRIYQFTLSAGIVLFPEDGTLWSDLMCYATVAMEKSKKNGKNQVQFYDDELLKTTLREQLISQEMGTSIRYGFEGFQLYFQPINRISDAALTGAEALLRFNSSQFGQLSPVEFIPILEKNRLIIEVGKWVLSEAVQTCKQWTAFQPGFTVNVNVSMCQPLDHDFCNYVFDTLVAYDLDPKHLTLELTESYLVQNESSITPALNHLRSMGIRIAMDDFGTGYSSLGRLHRLPTDIVKIDRMFVSSLKSGSYNYSFVQSVIRLCHNAGITVCMEGIESQEELINVNNLYADTFQGFYVSRPLPPDSFQEKFLGGTFDWGSLAVPVTRTPERASILNDHGLLKLMVDTSPLAITLWNEKHEIIGCNQSAVTLLNLRNEDEVLERFFELSPEYQACGLRSTDLIHDHLSEVFRVGQCSFHWMHRQLDGTPIPTEITLVQIQFQGVCLVASYAKDIRHQIKAEELLQSSNSRMNAILNASPLGCTWYNGRGDIVGANPAFFRMLGIPECTEDISMITGHYPQLQPDGSSSRGKMKRKIQQALDTGSCMFEWMYQTVGGTLVPAMVTFVRTRYDNRDTVIGFVQDLRELNTAMTMNKRLQEMAFYDDLTGSSTRAAFLQQLDDRLKELKDGDLFPMVLIDFDHFKEINDTYGHLAGDAALRTSIAIIRELLPEDALLGRFGGDEFMLQPGWMNRDALAVLLEKIIYHVRSQKIQNNDICFHASVSIGAAFWTKDCTNRKTLFHKADKALYTAKSHGRNQYVILSEVKP